MKLPTFKLPPNSLFAILLRSRWWISLLLALAIVLAAFLALPRVYAPMGAMASLPFWAIAIVALARQWRQPSARQREAALARLQMMNTREFQDLIEQALAADGYAVAPSARPGADLRLLRQGAITLMSYRRFKAHSLGEQPLRELTSAMQAEGAAEGIVVSLGQATEQAEQWATRHAVRIMPAEALVDWLHQSRLV
ncbi:MAG: restriction endonuclease [Comamonas sp.]